MNSLTTQVPTSNVFVVKVYPWLKAHEADSFLFG